MSDTSSLRSQAQNESNSVKVSLHFLNLTRYLFLMCDNTVFFFFKLLLGYSYYIHATTYY